MDANFIKGEYFVVFFFTFLFETSLEEKYCEVNLIQNRKKIKSNDI